MASVNTRKEFDKKIKDSTVRIALWTAKGQANATAALGCLS